MAEEEEALAVALHSSNLRRKFTGCSEQSILAAGVAGQAVLLSSVTAQRHRLNQDEENAELRAALAEAKADSERHRTRCTELEEQLRSLCAAGDAQHSAPALPSDGTAAHVSPPTAMASAPLQPLPRGASADHRSVVESASPASPRALIEELQRARLEAVSGTSGASLSALVGRALAALSHDLYAGAGAVLAELMQNADDACYGSGAQPTLSIRVTRGGDGCGGALGLLVESNEAGCVPLPSPPSARAR
jgi:hypothetical protein